MVIQFSSPVQRVKNGSPFSMSHVRSIVHVLSFCVTRNSSTLLRHTPIKMDPIYGICFPDCLLAINYTDVVKNVPFVPCFFRTQRQVIRVCILESQSWRRVDSAIQSTPSVEEVTNCGCGRRFKTVCAHKSSHLYYLLL